MFCCSKLSLSCFNFSVLYRLDIIPLENSLYNSLPVSSFFFKNSNPKNFDNTCPRAVGFASNKSSKLVAVVKIVIKKSSCSPIEFLIKSSVSLRCSPVKFCNSPFDNFLKKSNSVFTFHSPLFDFFLSIPRAMI